MFANPSATKLSVNIVIFACVGTFLFMALIAGFCIVARHRTLRQADMEAQPGKDPVHLLGMTQLGKRHETDGTHINICADSAASTPGGVGEEGAISSTTPLPIYREHDIRPSSECPHTPPGLTPPPSALLPPPY